MLRCVGYIEVCIDMVCLVGLYFVVVLMEIMSEDGIMVCLFELRKMVDEWGLKLILICDLIVYCLK